MPKVKVLFRNAVGLLLLGAYPVVVVVLLLLLLLLVEDDDDDAVVVGGVVVLVFALRKSLRSPSMEPVHVPPIERISFSSPRNPLKYGITRHSGISCVGGIKHVDK